MAKYSVTHSCGHAVTHTLFGKHSGFGGRDSKLEWLETVPCLECNRKQEEEAREKQGREAQQANLRAGLAPLSGSEKQVLWGETIRHRTLGAFRAAGLRVKSAAEPNLLVESEIDRTISWLETQTEATWWIEHVGTLKSQEGLAPIFGMLSGKQAPASDAEILRTLIIESPHLTEEGATALGLREKFLQRQQTRLAEKAREEIKQARPSRPSWLQALRDKHGDRYWNGKIYRGPRIYINGEEMSITSEQEREILAYQKAFADWNSKLESTK